MRIYVYIYKLHVYTVHAQYVYIRTYIQAEIEYLAGRARMITTFEEERNLVQQQLDKATEKFQCHVRESEKLEVQLTTIIK